MSQPELLKRVIGVLERAGVEYMVTGSTVSSLQGEPRATHDIDLVVSLNPASIPALLAAFPAPEFYLDEESVREAVARGDMFNLLEPDTGDKVDFWLLTADEFDQARFGRRISEVVAGLSIKVSRPEDTVLMKLRWCDMSGGSAKQFQDAVRVYEVQFDYLDQGLLDHWAQKLGVVDLLRRLRTEANP
jgi:hypothetical protein